MSNSVSGMILPGCSFADSVARKVPGNQPILGSHIRDDDYPADRYLCESTPELSTTEPPRHAVLWLPKALSSDFPSHLGGRFTRFSVLPGIGTVPTGFRRLTSCIWVPLIPKNGPFCPGNGCPFAFNPLFYRRLFKAKYSKPIKRIKLFVASFLEFSVGFAAKRPDCALPCGKFCFLG